MSAWNPMSDRELLIDVKHVTKHFPLNDKVFGSSGVIHAVDDVSIQLYAGEVLGVVGESGCGKSTLSNLVMMLEEPTSGTITWRGKDISTFNKDERLAYRREVQMVFQDTLGSLDPRMTIGDVLTEPYAIHKDFLPKDKWPDKVRELLALVGLDPNHANRYPHQFSGGQRQRIGIARALALEPRVLVCDEPVSALDVSVQAQVVNLLMDLQQRLSLTYLFIAHDLRLVRHICERVAVMYRGRIVEMGRTGALFEAPAHPYTKALLSAIPVPDPKAKRERVVLDPGSFDRMATLREVGNGHWAAI
jgi:oligopeptide transport system ATP-binding protein